MNEPGSIHFCSWSRDAYGKCTRPECRITELEGCISLRDETAEVVYQQALGLEARIAELETDLARERESVERQAEQYSYLLRVQERGMDRAERAEARLAAVISELDRLRVEWPQSADPSDLEGVRAAATGDMK